METTFRLKVTEIDIAVPKILKIYKEFFKKNTDVEITINVTGTKLEKEKISEEYWAELKRRINNIDTGKNTITFTEDEFDKYSEKLLDEYK